MLKDFITHFKKTFSESTGLNLTLPGCIIKIEHSIYGDDDALYFLFEKYIVAKVIIEKSNPVIESIKRAIDRFKLRYEFDRCIIVTSPRIYGLVYGYLEGDKH